MKPENVNSRNESDDKNPTKHVPSVDEATDFLGSHHGNTMPEPETAPEKTLNPEEASSLKKKNRPNLDSEQPSIH